MISRMRPAPVFLCLLMTTAAILLLAPQIPNVHADYTATIVIVKDAVSYDPYVPYDPQDFQFSVTGGLTPASFLLDDDDDPTLSNTQTFSNVGVGTFVVTESVMPSWDLLHISCQLMGDSIPGGWDSTWSADLPNRRVSISISNIWIAGQRLDCTFSDTTSSIVIVKEATPMGAWIPTVPDDPQDFQFSVTGGLTPASFLLDDDDDPTLSNTQTYGHVSAGTYVVTETVPPGWDLLGIDCHFWSGGPSGGWVSTWSVDLPNRRVTIYLAAGERVDCTFGDITSSIAIVKDAVPNAPQDSQFSVTGGLTPASFLLDDDDDPTLSNTQIYSVVAAGTYVVTESATPSSDPNISCELWEEGPPGGWVSTWSVDLPNRRVTIYLAAGERVDCTFTDTKRGHIIVDKVTVPSGDLQSFSLSMTGGPDTVSQSFSLTDTAPAYDSGAVRPGTYSVSETLPTGWDLTSAICSDGSPVTSIVLDPGETVTCTFTDTKRGLTFDQLATLVRQYHQDGLIDNQGLSNSLISKLENAQAALRRGQPNVAKNVLRAFINEVQAQSGKHINAIAADALINWATLLGNTF
jgi:hypothetical protein